MQKPKGAVPLRQAGDARLVQPATKKSPTHKQYFDRAAFAMSVAKAAFDSFLLVCRDLGPWRK